MSELWKHQQIGIQRFVEQNGIHGFFFETGTGKTRTTVECLRHLYSTQGKMLPTLILSPLITLENWKREIQKFSKINDSDVIVLHGSITKKKKILDKLLQNPNKIVITNWEALLSDYVFDYFMKNPAAVIVGDELHSIKTHNSKRTKKALQLSDKATYKIGLTGTPYLNTSEDLWSQIYFLDGGKRLDKKFHWFKTKYFYDQNSGMPSHVHFPNWKPRPGSKEVIQGLLSDVVMYAEKKLCLDLPPLIRKEVFVEMGSAQKKAYEEMKRDFVTYLGDSACIANLALTKGLRLQQILSGHLPMESGDVVRFDDNPRMDALKELLATHSPDHKIIVWAAFKENHKDIGRLCEQLGIGHVYLTGDQSKDDKEASMKAFEEDPMIRVCIGNQSVGIGINLVSSDMAIYYSKNFNLGQDIQSEARNYRSGSERHQTIIRYDLVCLGSFDERVNEALASKKQIGTELLKAFCIDL